MPVMSSSTQNGIEPKWFMSIQTEREVEQVTPSATSAVGIDMGIKRFATFNDGSFLEPLNSFKKHEQRLAKYQRRMARKVKGSCNWKKAKSKVNKVHSDIANARKDFIHKVTSTISKSHTLVVIEDLKVGNMSRSAKGTGTKPGRNVRQKAGLNRAILDQGWFEFRRQLKYKLNWQGGMLLPVPAHYTSQTCPKCGHVHADNRKSQALFLCVNCAYTNNADVVGAMNILERGQRLLACGEECSGLVRKRKTKQASVKQEPTDVTMQNEYYA
jgi:putative transposase